MGWQCVARWRGGLWILQPVGGLVRELPVLEFYVRCGVLPQVKQGTTAMTDDQASLSWKLSGK